jgi:hypothetical protein
VNACKSWFGRFRRSNRWRRNECRNAIAQNEIRMAGVIE